MSSLLGLLNLIRGNFILLVIGGCSVIGMCIFIERCLFLRKAQINTNQFLMSLRGNIQQGEIIKAIQNCDDHPGSISSIIKSGLLRHDQPKDHIEAAMEVSGLAEISKLERNAKILSIIAHISPLIGLLGTVLGFIQAFSEMRQTGMMDITTSKIGQSMEFALITTAAGLVVAIPAVVAYNYLVSRIESMVLEMQTTSSEVVDLLLLKRVEYEV